MKISRELYQDEFVRDGKTNGTQILATLYNNKLRICHLSYGSATKEIFGNSDVEYFVDFDEANTSLFKNILKMQEDEHFMNLLATTFTKSSAHRDIQEFSNKHNIVFKIFVF